MPITFQQALEQSNGAQKTVLLGNGFSIEGDPAFDYNRIFDGARLDADLVSIFEDLDTVDFEMVIDALEDAALTLLQVDGINQELLMLLDADFRVRQRFAEQIANHHPLHSEVFHPVDGQRQIQERNCFSFLSNFSTILTTNYDLLLYWAIMLNLNYRNDTTIVPPVIQTDDGFRRRDGFLIYTGRGGQRVFFLHGGLFLQDGRFGSAIKMESGDDRLLEVITAGIRRDIQSLIVLEGASDTKTRRIREYEYLREGLQALSSMGGDIFIHGHSLGQNDQHIFDAISNSNINNIFISVLHEREQEDAKLILAQQRFRQDNIFMYDAGSARAWE